MENIKYTDEQLAIAKDVENFLSRPIIKMEDLAYTIKGYAGTGKSTLAKHIVDKLLKSKKRVGLSAPTHTAKNNISDKVGLPAETLQKMLGLKPNADMESYSPNVKDFKPVSDPLLNLYDILIIDECSMINQHLFNFLLVSAEEHRTRIIFMGDPFQLPPISDGKTETISKTFHLPHQGTLDTILRQSHENPNTELIATIIEDLKKGTSVAFNRLLQRENVVNDLGGILFHDAKEFYKTAIDVFKEADSERDNRFITFTNVSVTGINNYINKNINGKPFTVGQYLFGYKTIVRDVNEVSLHADNTGGFLTLKDVYITNSALYKIKDFKEEDVKFRGISVPCYVVYTEQSSTPFLIPKKDTIKDYAEEVNNLVEYGNKTRKWSQMYEFRDMFLLNFSIPDNNYHNRDLVSKSIDYAYAITTHKSQGATFKNSFINLPAYVGIRDIEFRNKLLYVAVTRTSGFNHFLNF